LTDKKKERVIALAGLFQAAQMVTDLAKNGKCDDFYYQCLCESLFVFSPNTTIDVYGNNLKNLQCGFKLLSDLSAQKINREQSESARYALSMLALFKQLNKNSSMLEIIRSRLNHMHYNKTHFSDDSLQLASSISGLYQDTLSTLKFRIQVTGNMHFLKEVPISDKVRVMLFAGIRASMLWHQLGGSKWQIIFGRAEIEKISSQLLEEITSNPIH
jgi:high frequency lysogenization protein